MGMFRKKAKVPKEQHRHLLMAGGVLILIALSVLGGSIAYYYTPPRITPCSLYEGLCNASPAPPVPVPQREYTDEEVAAFAIAQDLLARSHMPSSLATPKVAFMFLTPGPMPFEFIWEAFFKGQERRYSVYVHASEMETLKSVWKSKVFAGRGIRSGKVYWGGIQMIDAEKRLLAQALLDLDNQFFVLLSESCIPLYDFDYIYKSLIYSSVSFVDNFDDPGPHGVGRYKQDGMQPEIQRNDWRKGAQWFAVMRKHALLLVVDHLYYAKFRDFCKPGNDNRNCYPDEHYVQTYLHIMDPAGLSNWTITHVDWSDGGWHPKSYKPEDVTVDALEHVQRLVEHVHVSSDGLGTLTSIPCLWNGEQRPCFLFARKFMADTVEVLAEVLPKVTRNGGYLVAGIPVVDILVEE